MLRGKFAKERRIYHSEYEAVQTRQLKDKKSRCDLMESCPTRMRMIKIKIEKEIKRYVSIFH